MIKTSIFGGGCFWCTEAIFKKINGVKSVLSGYIGGHIVNPTYEQVCTGTTGHSEVIKIEYDSSVISFNDLLAVFFSTHDPTTLNRQGNDVGTQYRSSIFTNDEDEIKIISNFLPEQLSENEINDIITNSIRSSGAKSIKDMGKVINLIKDEYNGKMDFGVVSKIIKAKLLNL